MMPRRTARVRAPPQSSVLKKKLIYNPLVATTAARPEKPLCFNGCALISLGARHPLLDLTFKGNQKRSSYDHRDLSHVVSCVPSIVKLAREQIRKISLRSAMERNG
jgi:hypothetical protein